MIYTVDGSSGSGKTSLCNGLAKKFANENYETYSFSSGVLYRLLAKELNENKNLTLKELLSHFDESDLTYDGVSKMFMYRLNLDTIAKNYVLNPDLFQDENTASLASKLSQNKEVRTAVQKFLKAMADNFASANNTMLFMDGRDLGSVVFKDTAKMKFFLEIDIEKASKRRAEQLYSNLSEAEKLAKAKDIKNFLKTRNDADKNRSIDPLVKTDDSIELDTSATSLQEMVDNVYKLIKQDLKQTRTR